MDDKKPTAFIKIVELPQPEWCHFTKKTAGHPRMMHCRCLRCRPSSEGALGSNIDSEVPLKEVQALFEEHLAAAGKSANTLFSYTRDLRLFGEWFALTNVRALS